MKGSRPVVSVARRAVAELFEGPAIRREVAEPGDRQPQQKTMRLKLPHGLLLFLDCLLPSRAPRKLPGGEPGGRGGLYPAVLPSWVAK